MGRQALISFTSNRLRALENWSGGIVLGILIVCCTSLFLNSALSCSFSHFTVQCIISFALMTYFRKHNSQHQKIREYPSFAAFSFLALFFAFLCYLTYVAYIQIDGKMILTGENDLYLEFGYIGSFVSGVNFKRGFLTGLLLPLVSGNSGRSEYLPTIFAALLHVAGFSIQFSVFVQTLLLFASITLLQFSLTLRLSKSEFASVMSIPVLYLVGGFGFMNFLVSRNRLDPSVDYIFYLGSNNFNMWGHPILHCILTSRVVMLTMGLSILVFVLLDVGLVNLPGVIALACIVIRPQTALALFIIYWLWGFEQFLPRLGFLIPAVGLFKMIHLYPKRDEPLWSFIAYANSMFPVLSFAVRIFGLLFPSFVFVNRHLLERLVAPLVTFYTLSRVSLQTELRFNFFALVATVVPLFAAISLAGMVNFREKWKLKEARGVVNCAIIFCAAFMCLSSLAGIWARLDQKFPAWDSDGVALALWMDKNTDRMAVVASKVPGRWNPAVVLAGRQGYVPFSPTLQSAEYYAGNRAAEVNAFLAHNATLLDVDYFVVEKKSQIAEVMKKKIGVWVDLVYENDRYQLMHTRP
jgi:hypothetical protein